MTTYPFRISPLASALLLGLTVYVFAGLQPARSAAQAVTVTNVFQNHYTYGWPIGNQDCPSGYNIPSGQYNSSFHLERGHAIHHLDPKNSTNDYWVYWAHLDNSSYSIAEVAIFKSTTECGPYTLQSQASSPYTIDGYDDGFQPGGWQSRDENIFRDTNQTYNPDGTVASYASAYLVTASDSENSVTSSSGSTCGYANDSMAIFRMTSDYLGIDATTNPSTKGANWVFICDQREAPVILKSGSEYFLITSQAAGWYPSQGGYGASSNPLTGWTPDPLSLGNASTFGGQTSDGFEIQGTEANTYVLSFDHLGGADAKNPALGEEYDTGGILLPVILNSTAGTATLNWEPAWTVDNTTGVLTLPTLTNVAVGTTANGTTLTAAASGSTTYVPGNAVDGLYTTRWAGSSSGSSAFAAAAPVDDTNNGGTTTLCPVTGAISTTKCNPSLVVDLGSVQPIQEIDLSFYMVKGSEPYYSYKIAYSTDNVHWSVNDYTTFASGGNASTNNISSVPFSNDITYGFNYLPVSFSARYVALVETGVTQQNNPSPFYGPGATEMAVIKSTAPTSPATPTVTVTPSTTTPTANASFTASVGVTGPVGQPAPTGYVQLSVPGYSSEVYALVGGAATFTVPAGATTGGAETLSVAYRPDPISVPVYGTAVTAGTASINVAGTVPITVPNYSFETPSTTTYVYNPSGASWTFTASSGANGSGVATNGSGFTASNSSAPAGTQVGFIQGTSSIYQTLTGLTVGQTYKVTVAMSQRQNKTGGQLGNTIAVRQDSNTLITFNPPQSSVAYADYSVNFTATATSHVIGFYGTNALANGTYSDNTTFIDNVRIVALTSGN